MSQTDVETTICEYEHRFTQHELKNCHNIKETITACTLTSMIIELKKKQTNKKHQILLLL